VTLDAPILRIAFGDFLGWSADIRANLDARYAPSFVDLATADLDAYDAIVPLQRGDYGALSQRPDLRGRKFLHPSPRAEELCHDKLALTRSLIAEGFGDIVPPLRAPGPPYPYVWKRRRSGFGVHCHVVNGPEEEAGHDLNDPEWFAQTLAAGSMEFATHILRVGGEVRYISTFAYDMGEPTLVKGERHRPLTIRFQRDCRYRALFADILDRLDYEGLACFDFKSANGVPQLFEINPRFGASLSFDVTSYLDAYVAALNPKVGAAASG
jgi:hypothetical protein